MSSPFRENSIERQRRILANIDYLYRSNASPLNPSLAARHGAPTAATSRTGPTSFSNILNPTTDGDWSAAPAANTTTTTTTTTTTHSRHHSLASTASLSDTQLYDDPDDQDHAIMTQNGATTLDGGGGSSSSDSMYPRLTVASRAFELFMPSRAALDVFAPASTSTAMPWTLQTEPASAAAAAAAATGPLPTGPLNGSNGSAHSYAAYPRPSHLEGSQYMARLEQQMRRQALSHRARNGNANGVGGDGGVQVSNGTGPGAAGKVMNPTHMGIARDVVERNAPTGAAIHPHHSRHEDLAGNDLVDPLPTRWGTSKEEKAAGLEVLADGLEVLHTGPRISNERDHEACAVRADHHMPLQCGLYYFEVEILSRKHADTTIAIGFSSKTVALNRAPGWEPDSWGYHGDDGHIFAAHTAGKNYGPTFTSNDVVGCGVNFRTGTAFFTKNGRFLGQAFKDVKGKLYPTVGLKKNGERIRVNFGQTEFKFDINGLMKAEIARLEKEIEAANTSKLAPPLNETDLIQQLVLQFLQNDGYVETARAFAEEIRSEKQALCLDPNEQVPGVDIRDDEDANNRQRIRRAILEGDIDKALKYTNAYYPSVLKEHEQVYFRLRCRKFIEMIRREAELNLGGDRRAHNGHSHPPTDEDMELDDDDMGHDNENGMDLSGSGDLTQVTLLYGQSLQAEYAGDERREVRTALEEIFSLMAYQNPLKEDKVAHLLDRKGRVAVAEELNSAILQSLGKSSRAALENVYAQTSVLLDNLAETGGPGAFVTLKGILDEVDDSTPVS